MLFSRGGPSPIGVRSNCSDHAHFSAQRKPLQSGAVLSCDIRKKSNISIMHNLQSLIVPEPKDGESVFHTEPQNGDELRKAPMTPRTYHRAQQFGRRSYIEQMNAESAAIDALALVPAGAAARRKSLMEMYPRHSDLGRKGRFPSVSNSTEDSEGDVLAQVNAANEGAVRRPSSRGHSLIVDGPPQPMHRTDSRGHHSFIVNEPAEPPSGPSLQFPHLTGLAAAAPEPDPRTMLDEQEYGAGSTRRAKAMLGTTIRNVLLKTNSIRLSPAAAAAAAGESKDAFAHGRGFQKKAVTLWPRDTLFRYLQAMENVQARRRNGTALMPHSNIPRCIRGPISGQAWANDTCASMMHVRPCSQALLVGESCARSTSVVFLQCECVWRVGRAADMILDRVITCDRRT